MVCSEARSRIARAGEVDFQKSAVGLPVEDQLPLLVDLRKPLLRLPPQKRAERGSVLGE